MRLFAPYLRLDGIELVHESLQVAHQLRDGRLLSTGEVSAEELVRCMGRAPLILLPHAPVVDLNFADVREESV